MPVRGPLPREEVLALVIQLVVGMMVLIAAVTALSWFLRSELQALGASFVQRFGALGMAGGAFVADGLHFPIPPQFYLFAGFAGGFGPVATFSAVLVGSVLGGLMAFTIARRGARLGFLARRALAARQLVGGLFARYGYLGLALAGLLPISFWSLCSLGGLLQLPYRGYGVLGFVRIPRLLVSYVIIVLAWRETGP